MDATLAPGIVVLNKKYFPRDALSAAQVGASSFTFSVLRILLEAKVLSGVVLYSRNEELCEAYCETEEDWNGIPVVTVYFHFRMSQPGVASALGLAFDHISFQGSKRPSPIVYYQTDTLLQFHPQGYQFCVTHHGPFVSHFTREFSPDLARLAFGGDSDKVDILEQQQRTGIQRLLQDNLGTVLAHSGLQQRVLEDEGLSAMRFKTLRPPIGIPPSQSPNILPKRMQSFIASSKVLLFTAVARLDYFKNVELLVESGLELLERGLPVRVLIVGDPEGDDARRQALLKSVPADKRGHFLILPRLPKDHLYALFAATRRNGIFLCPSRYETLGITPLEAAASAVTTLMTETPNVEALAFMPSQCSVPQHAASIASRVEQIYLDGVPQWAEMVKKHVRPETSLEGFGDDLLQAWAEMTRSRRFSSTAQGRRTSVDQKRVPKLATAYLSGGLMELLKHVPLSPVSMRMSA
ncbi:hypothetical protein SCAR479_00146 [Seiridium cardinale]|uniref:Glycosyl transferase family 1 domain-containing protein n=1 Tax=Seiridium cardinale TaxID=138064 RepID=A0ABR2Y8Z5_9PEZI